jgi:hypothetical protein
MISRFLPTAPSQGDRELFRCALWFSYLTRFQSPTLDLFVVPTDDAVLANSWDASSQENLAVYRELATDPAFWKSLSKHFTAENHAEVISQDHVSCVKSICERAASFQQHALSTGQANCWTSASSTRSARSSRACWQTRTRTRTSNAGLQSSSPACWLGPSIGAWARRTRFGTGSSLTWISCCGTT